MIHKIEIKSPTRVDLAGGTLDMWPLYNFVGGAKTINIAVDIWTYCTLVPREDSRIILESQDLNRKVEFNNISDCLADKSGDWKLYQLQIAYWRPLRGFELITRSESPVGAGLGGSSSLTISMMKAFASFMGRRFKDVHSMVHVAHNLEASQLGTPTGTQDYYPAVTAGVSIIDYSFDGIKQEVINSGLLPLRDSSFLVYTGRAHHSGLNNFEVLKAAVEGDSRTIEALNKIKIIAEEMSSSIKQGIWNNLASLFHREYEARLELCPAFSSPEIEQLDKICREAGADAVKICGAGGGGCVWIWATKKDCHRHIKEVCEKAGFRILTATPVDRHE